MNNAQPSRPLAIIGIILVLAVTVLGGLWLRNLYSTDSPTDQVEPTTTVVATLPHVGSWLENILPDTVAVEVIVTGEVHDFSLTPQAIATAENATAIVANGAGIETWLPTISEALPHVPVIETAPQNKIVAGDPHTWLDPIIASDQVGYAARELAKLLPEHANAIALNAAAYQDELSRLDQDIREQRAQLTNNAFVVFHDAFGYFARRYNLEQVGQLVETPHEEPTFADVEALVAAIEEHRITTLFIETGDTPDLASSLASDLKLKLAELDPLETIEPTASAYSEAMRVNARTLFASLL